MRVNIGLYTYALCCSLLGIAISGCYTPQKAKRQVTKAYVTYPEVLLGFCGDVAPPLDSVSTETRYIQGATQYLPGDTVTVDCDSVRLSVKSLQQATGKKSLQVRIPCPPCPFRVDTLFQNRYVQLENKAAIEACKLRNEKLQEERDGFERKAVFRLWWALIATALVIGGAALKYFKIL